MPNDYIKRKDMRIYISTFTLKLHKYKIKARMLNLNEINGLKIQWLVGIQNYQQNYNNGKY